jgi:catechol 2,3-dioxygenase-like lactoylglutathione lyase family enzyme
VLKSIDHVVLTVHDLTATIRFYEDILDVPILCFGQDLYVLQIGSQRIALRSENRRSLTQPATMAVGASEICFLTETPLTVLVDRLRDMGVSPVEGPCQRSGATGNLTSIYLRDPDGNLLEISNAS